MLTDIHYGDLLDFHIRHGAAGTMAVRSHEWQHPFGVVQTKGTAELADRGVVVSHVSVWNQLQREGRSFKKNRSRQRAGSA